MPGCELYQTLYFMLQLTESLESLIDELSYLRDQALTADPIAAFPSDIQEQIIDNQVWTGC